jgi:serine/threonine protein kinase/Tfp pilus assembly protein PilF
MKCPKCNFENPSDTKFCGECAAPLPSSKEISASPTETLETPKEELTTGSVFAGRYQIIEVLGKGGMGKVYRALDKKLNEEVALKLVKPEIASDKKTLERFSNELKIARKIAHKNVGRMYELMEEKGTHFITMEYVPGQDLKGLIRQSGQLATGTTISIAKQVCEGLAEAHELGVVHRDLKPQNIMIDKEGNSRIMDFGIARSLKAKGITDAGVMIGTPEYMSPEQVDAKEIDQRSDIYSLGVILYEMVTGRVPFEGDTPLSVAVKQKTETPEDPRKLNSQIPEDLSRVILRCIEKDKGKRYQSAGELRSELINLEKGIPTTERVVPKRKPITSKEITVTFGLKKLLIPALVVVALLVAAVAIWQLLPQKEVAPIPSDKPSIAVLPFADLSPQKDQEYFCDGMTDEISAKLSRLKNWKVISRTSVMRYKSTDKDIKQIGQELDVTTILEGSVRKEKDNIRVIATLINIADSSQIWSETYDQKLKSVFVIQNDIAEKIASALKSQLSPEDKELLQKKPTENLEAYNLYLQGRWFWNKRTDEGLKKAIEYFDQVIEVDSNYAQAYAGLADSYTLLSEYGSLPPKQAFPKAKASAVKALEIDESIAESYTSLAYVKLLFDWDWAGAEELFKRAIELNPSYATAPQWYSFLLLVTGRFDESIAMVRSALKSDPLALILNTAVGHRLYFARRYDECIEEELKTLEMEPDFIPALTTLGNAYVKKGMFEDAILTFQRVANLSGGVGWGYQPTIGYAYAVSGQRENALNVLEEYKRLRAAKQRYISPYKIAAIYTGLGETDQAIEWLEKAYEERSILLLYLNIESLWDPLRSDPRFQDLLRRMNFPD